MTTIDPHHWELADQLVKATADSDEQTYLDALSEVATGGMRTAMGVIAALVPMHAPDPDESSPG